MVKSFYFLYFWWRNISYNKVLIILLNLIKLYHGNKNSEKNNNIENDKKFQLIPLTRALFKEKQDEVDCISRTRYKVFSCGLNQMLWKVALCNFFHTRIFSVFQLTFIKLLSIHFFILSVGMLMLRNVIF